MLRLLFIFLIFSFGSVSADPPLEIIQVFSSDSAGAVLQAGCMSPGDLDGDGYSELFVAEIGPPNRLLVFSGGNPPDLIPDKIIEGWAGIFEWLPDLNKDGFNDFAMRKPVQNPYELVDIWFGDDDFMSKPDHDLTISNMLDSFSCFGCRSISSGDFNGDGVDDFAVSAREISGSHPQDHGLVYVFAGDRNLPTSTEDEPDLPLPSKHDFLKQNYPNPFNSSTSIIYHRHGVAEREIELNIYNILGRKVRTIFQGIQSGGSHSAFWDGLDDYNHTVSSGLYFCILKTDLEVSCKKIILLK